VKRYATIVVDPPWPYERARYRFAWRPGAPSGGDLEFIRYPIMRLHEIAALPVRDLAAEDAHLYLWSTQRFFIDAHAIAESWGFSVSKVLTWCKPPTGFALGGTYGSASEFALFCRRGHLAAKAKVPRDWFVWPRAGGHSAKPEAFLDMVETVSPGPYLELFARRQRLGWDTWGDEALCHVEINGAGYRDAATPPASTTDNPAK
jgi:N6-adenosine-specific RNA methylase IME4